MRGARAVAFLEGRRAVIRRGMPGRFRFTSEVSSAAALSVLFSPPSRVPGRDLVLVLDLDAPGEPTRSARFAPQSARAQIFLPS